MRNASHGLYSGFSRWLSWRWQCPAPELRAITVPTVPGQSGSETPVAVPTASPEPQQPASEAITPESLLKTPAAVSPTAVEPSADPPTPTMLLMSVTEYGVGTAVEDRRLVGGSDRFREGTRVAFWTRVLGGTSGQGIDHVWLRESVEAMRISLDVGGASWRTHSVKTLHQGAAGNWAVEARDEAGRVLARSEFICVR